MSQSITALCSCRWPAPCPALASVAMMTMSSGNPVPSPVVSMSVAIGMRVLRRTVHTPSPTWLLSRTIWVVRSCKSCRFSWTISSCSESLGGVAVMRVSHDCRREGSTQASCAKEPQRQSKLGFGLFSADGGGKKTSQWQIYQSIINFQADIHVTNCWSFTHGITHKHHTRRQSSMAQLTVWWFTVVLKVTVSITANTGFHP